jgi:hypothetical protein
MKRRGSIQTAAITAVLIVGIAAILWLGFSSATRKESHLATRTVIQDDKSNDSADKDPGQTNPR